MRSRHSNEISFGNEKERDLWSSIQPAFTSVCLVGSPIIAAPWGGGEYLQGGGGGILSARVYP